MDLTIEQTELLFEATEIFQLWYAKYYDEPPSFSELLEINHVKVMDIAEMLDSNEEEITLSIVELKETYLKLLAEY